MKKEVKEIDVKKLKEAKLKTIESNKIVKK
jgi:hypothetical protein